jgi:fatty acid-binding protein DegV
VPVRVIVDGMACWELCEVRSKALRQAQHEGRRISTSQVNPADFRMLHSSLLGRFGRAISVHISRKLSGTYATTKLIAARFGNWGYPINLHSLNARLDNVLELVRQAIDAGVPSHLLEKSRSNLARAIIPTHPHMNRVKC